ncbi:MAG: 5'/3'-nucleotidase SurE [Pelolinea sp.]|jgi:5'-nucleotidase|nr:5'/3'-nucleotidase SurE [Pelolinea sp.]
MNLTKKQILLTNDDGIDSPGLWAAAAALSSLGFVTVVAPREHCSAMGRGFGRHEDEKVEVRKMVINNQEWDVHAVGGTPSLTVLHGILEVMPKKPDLVVSGINYGENVSTDISYSGTVGAAMEAASLGIPALASSYQVMEGEWDSFKDIDFSVAAFFTHFFARRMLATKLPPDVHLLNLVIPQSASQSTPWQITRLAPGRYYNPYIKQEGSCEGHISSHIIVNDNLPDDSDVIVAIKKKLVSVTPVSLDLTSRVDFHELDARLRK